MSHFEASDDNICFFVLGSKFIRCENKKLEEICDTSYNIFKGGDYYMSKGTRGSEFNFYNYIKKELTVENIDLSIQSIYRTDKVTAAITIDQKIHILEKGQSTKNAPLSFDDEAKIIHVTENNIFVVTQQTTPTGSDTQLIIFDLNLNQVSANKFYPRDGASRFTITNTQMVNSIEGNQYFLIEYAGATTPIILKKITETRYAAPRMKNPNLPGVSRFSELRVKHSTNTIFVGTGRKIYELKLTEKDQPETAEPTSKAPRDTNIILHTNYKDQLSRVKRAEIRNKEMGADNLLSRVIANPTQNEQIYFSKNNKDNQTSILRYNFNTQSELSAVKEVKKPEKQSYFVDIVVNKENKFVGLDDNGLIYLESDNDVMNPTDLMTYPRHSTFNTTRSRQIAANESRTKAYFPTDDGDSLYEMDILKAGGFKALKNAPHGILEVKCIKDDTLFGVRSIQIKNKLEYLLFKYDIGLQKVVDEVNIGLTTGYHFEALRVISDQRVLIVANKRSDKDPKVGTSPDMAFAVFTTNLDREFLSDDTPISNKFGHCNVVEVMTTLQGLPLIIISKGATIYLLIIDSETKIKQIDNINFSEADGPDSTIESACYNDGKLYVVRNRNVLHRVEFKEL